uniref:uncharacterized protein LOC117610836 n=1 Tax=Osmia lignaria TaxID=473952 RepID=UPI001478FCE2|nr:uncharacterized protein LOC117610836 [Osmia lignaria]
MTLFRAFSPDQAVVVRKPTGTYGFITFPTAELALRAVQWVEATKPIFHKRKIKAAIADSWNEAALLRPRGRPDPFPGWEPRTSPPLPEEVLARIARFLNFADRARMEGVCRAWRAGALASYASEQVLSTTDQRWPQGWAHPSVDTEGLRWAIMRLGPYVSELRLDDRWVAERLRPQVLGIAARGCPRLTTIDLTGATVRPSALRDLASNAERLQRFYLGRTIGNVEPELSEVFVAAPHLASFVATGSGFAGAALSRMAPTLQEVRLRDCASLSSASVAACLAAQRSLSSVELVQCRALSSAEPLDALMNNEDLHRSVQELVVIDIDFAPIIDGAEEEEIPDAADVPDPVFIELQLGPVEAARSLPELFRQLTILRVLFCGWVDVTFIRSVGEHLHQLLELDISGCSNVRGQFALESLGNLPRLEKITINNLHPTVSAPALATIATLEEVRARDSQGITDEDTTAIVRGCSRLVALDVEGCLGVTNQTVIESTEIVRRQGRATVLSLSVGGTSVDRWVRVRPSLVLRVLYDRVYQPILRDF